MRLILFDVDGTLLTARGAGRRALARALAQVYGTAGAIDQYDARGQTDLRIVRDLMEGAGIPRETVRARLEDCFEAYLRALRCELGEGRGVATLPGVADLVPRLDREARVVVGLLTGNIEQGARIKLEPTGLWPYFRVGAFGSDDADRRRLPSLAARRAAALVGHPFQPGEVVIVGDTPRDVQCARWFGAVAVAVATGQHAAGELVAERPDLFLESLADVDAVVRALLAR